MRQFVVVLCSVLLCLLPDACMAQRKGKEPTKSKVPKGSGTVEWGPTQPMKSATLDAALASAATAAAAVVAAMVGAAAGIGASAGADLLVEQDTLREAGELRRIDESSGDRPRGDA